MECKYCKGKCQKAGRQHNGAQKLYCSLCKKYQQVTYLYNACRKELNKMISTLVCESVSIRGIGRVLQIAIATVISRIKTIAAAIPKPAIPINPRFGAGMLPLQKLLPLAQECRMDNKRWRSCAVQQKELYNILPPFWRKYAKVIKAVTLAQGCSKG